MIEKNYGNGILASVYDNLRCDGKLRNNEILGNMENGIECCGNSNFIKAQFVRQDGEQRDHVQPEGGHPLRPGRRLVHLSEPDRYRG